MPARARMAGRRRRDGRRRAAGRRRSLAAARGVDSRTGVDRVRRGRDERIIIIIVGRAARRRPVPAVVIIVDAERAQLAVAWGRRPRRGSPSRNVVPDVLAVQFSTYAEVEAAGEGVDRSAGRQ